MSNQKKKKREKLVKHRFKQKRGIAKKTTEEWIEESKMPVINGFRVDIDKICKELWARKDGAFKLCTRQQIIDMVEQGFEDGEAELGTCTAMDGKVLCCEKATRCIIEGETRAFVCERHYQMYKAAKESETGAN